MLGFIYWVCLMLAGRKRSLFVGPDEVQSQANIRVCQVWGSLCLSSKEWVFVRQNLIVACAASEEQPRTSRADPIIPGSTSVFASTAVPDSHHSRPRHPRRKGHHLHCLGTPARGKCVAQAPVLCPHLLRAAFPCVLRILLKHVKYTLNCWTFSQGQGGGAW